MIKLAVSAILALGAVWLALNILGVIAVSLLKLVIILGAIVLITIVVVAIAWVIADEVLD